VHEGLLEFGGAIEGLDFVDIDEISGHSNIPACMLSAVKSP
jgi:hypothetical protein